ncbi:MAG: hypothetical protein P4L67_04185 [Candidatus Pacebacteria bacterium]|nr:hypothetical protein [Candidatus Paceibacterota bacterium]
MFNEEKPQLSPLVYTQLLMAVNDMGGKKNRDLIEKLVKHFINDKEILAVPQNWTPLHMYLLMLGVESANIADKEFTGNFPNRTPE